MANKPTRISEIVGRNVRLLRAQSAMAQSELAAEMSDLGFAFSQKAVSHIERGRRHVTVDELAALAGIFGHQPGNLLTDLLARDG